MKTLVLVAMLALSGCAGLSVTHFNRHAIGIGWNYRPSVGPALRFPAHAVPLVHQFRKQ